MADYISPWGGMPSTGGTSAYGYSEVPDYVKQHFQNYMTSGGHNVGFQDPNNPNLMWQAMNTLPGSEGEPGNMYGGYRVYKPSADGGFNWEPGSDGTSYDIYGMDGNYFGTEGFQKPTAQRTFNTGLASVLGMGALSQMGALGGAQAAGSGIGEAGGGLSAGAVSSPVVGGGAGAVTATPLLPAAAGGGTAGGLSGLLSSLGLSGGATGALGTVGKIGSLLSTISGLTGGSGGGSMAGTLGGALPAILGALSADRQGDASDRMQSFLNRGYDQINNLYSPGSPEYNALWEEMSRKDAAAGRNSQYGPRSVDLAARIAQIKAENLSRMTQGLAPAMQNALNQNAGKYAGLSGALGNMQQTGSLADIIGKLFGNVGASSDLDFSGGTSMVTPSSMSNDDIWNSMNGYDLPAQDLSYDDWWS